MEIKNNLFLKMFFVVFVFVCFVSSALAIGVTLSWDANTQPQLSGYNVYQGNSPGVYGNPVFVPAPTTKYYTGDLTPGEIYYFAVTAKSNTGVESPFSEEKFIAIPTYVASSRLIEGSPGGVTDIPDPLVLYSEYSPAVFSKYVFQLEASTVLDFSVEWPVIGTIDSDNCLSSSLANGKVGIWCFVAKDKSQEYFRFNLALRASR